VQWTKDATAATKPLFSRWSSTSATPMSLMMWDTIWVERRWIFGSAQQTKEPQRVDREDLQWQSRKVNSIVRSGKAATNSVEGWTHLSTRIISISCAYLVYSPASQADVALCYRTLTPNLTPYNAKKGVFSLCVYRKSYSSSVLEWDHVRVFTTTPIPLSPAPTPLPSPHS